MPTHTHAHDWVTRRVQMPPHMHSGRGVAGAWVVWSRCIVSPTKLRSETAPTGVRNLSGVEPASPLLDVTISALPLWAFPPPGTNWPSGRKCGSAGTSKPTRSAKFLQAGSFIVAAEGGAASTLWGCSTADPGLIKGSCTVCTLGHAYGAKLDTLEPCKDKDSRIGRQPQSTVLGK